MQCAIGSRITLAMIGYAMQTPAPRALFRGIQTMHWNRMRTIILIDAAAVNREMPAIRTLYSVFSACSDLINEPS